MSKIVVAYTLDSNCVELCTVSIASMAMKTKRDLKVYVMGCKLTETDKKRFDVLLKLFRNLELKIFNVNYECLQGLPTRGRFNLAVWARFLIPEYIEDDKVIYLDCDTVLLRDVAELYDIELGDNYYAAVIDVEPTPERIKSLKIPVDNDYVNSGVLLINNFLWQKNEKQFTEMKNLALKYGRLLRFPDQDFLQAWSYDKKRMFLDKKFNWLATNMSGDNKEGVVISHLAAGRRPWRNQKSMNADHKFWREVKEILDEAAKN